MKVSPRMAYSIIICLSVGSSFASGLFRKSEFWDPSEIQSIQTFWSEPGRYTISSTNKHAVQLTVAGSQWLWDYNKKRGKGKVAPGTVAPPINTQEEVWEAWIEAKIARDRYLASVAAAALNKPASKILPATPDPGFPPQDMVDLFGAPPVFAAVVIPNQYQIKFDSGTVTYQDHVAMRPRYAYYRFDHGTNSEGTRISEVPEEELNGLLENAGINKSEQKVFKAISLLEGGFDSVNTYDTGFVSVGFIQFASLKEGGHSLGETLLQYKKEDPENFKNDFSKYGINVTTDGLLVALDIEKGEEKVGPAANSQIILDKRLIATFQQAGKSAPYRQVQLKAAKRIYWPMGDKIAPIVNGKPMPGVLNDVIKTEAGQSVFLDRKVNTGSIGTINDCLTEIAKVKNIKNLSEFAKYESLVIRCMWYRFNPAGKTDLSQPEPCEMIPAVLEKYGRNKDTNKK